MGKSAMIRARIEPEIKEEAEAILKRLGLNASEAIGLFYHQIKLKKGLPFEVDVSVTPAESKVSAYSQRALIESSRRLSPAERLNAFFQHSFLMNQMSKSLKRHL